MSLEEAELPGADFRPGMYIGQLDAKEKLKRGLGVRIYISNDLTYENELAETSLAQKLQGSESLNKQIYEGEWQRNMRNGFGFEFFASGSYYQGGFRKDKPHGKGSFFNALTNEKYSGEWF